MGADSQQHLRPQGARPLLRPFLGQNRHILYLHGHAQRVAPLAGQGQGFFKRNGMPGQHQRPLGHGAQMGYLQLDIAGNGHPVLAAHHVLHRGNGRGVQGIGNLQNVPQVAFVPNQHILLALGHRLAAGQGFGFQHQAVHAPHAGYHGYGLVREHPCLGPQNGHQVQPSALGRGLHMLHHQADRGGHALPGGFQLHGVAELRRGFQRADPGRIPLGIQHMKGDLAIRGHPPVFHPALVQHRHGLAEQYVGFLPQAAGKGDFSLHHSLADCIPHKTL